MSRRCSAERHNKEDDENNHNNGNNNNDNNHTNDSDNSHDDDDKFAFQLHPTDEASRNHRTPPQYCL